MSADIANWLQVNIVNNPQVLKSLIALIILIVAIFLFSEKPTEKNLFRSRRVWGALLFVFAIFVFLFANIADLADAFIVWATIVLAGVAVFSFEESRRLRKQYKEREELDRKERLLNEIIEWATQILECGRDPAFTGQRLNLTGKRLTSFEFDLHIAIQSAFNVLSWRAVHIGFLAQHSIGNKGLNDAVEDTRTLVRQQAKLLSLASARKLKDNAAIGRHRKKVDDNAKKVIELAVKLL